jgi:hypothetical protein
MKLFSKRMGQDSIWTRELIPADSVLRKDLIRQDSILRKDLFAFAKFTSPCLSCPILMVADKRVCNRYDRIPEDVWDGIEVCPIFAEHKAS